MRSRATRLKSLIQTHSPRNRYFLEIGISSSSTLARLRSLSEMPMTAGRTVFDGLRSSLRNASTYVPHSDADPQASIQASSRATLQGLAVLGMLQRPASQPAGVLSRLVASDAEPFWTEFLRSLNRRGLRGVKLVISDSHEGIKAAASKVLRPPGSDAACTSCATRWPSPTRRSAGWCRRPSARSSCRTRRKPRRSNGVQWLTSSGTRCSSSRPAWTKPRTTCSPS
jgi:hypothetical protein